jgi:hypothetical protein
MYRDALAHQTKLLGLRTTLARPSLSVYEKTLVYYTKPLG